MLLVESRRKLTLDGLRGIAIILVISNHLFPSAFPGGFVGVDIFFVVSGLLVTSSALSKKFTAFNSFVADFACRRINRILPALIVCMAFTSVVTAFSVPHPITSIQTSLAALWGASNVFLGLTQTGYFSEPAELNTALQTWSLGVEEQFYLVFPLLILPILALRRDRLATFVIISLSVLSFLMFLKIDDPASPGLYFSMLSRFWELGLGVIVAITVIGNTRGIKLKRVNEDVVILAFVVGLIFIALLGNKSNVFSGVVGAIVLTLPVLIIGYCKDLSASKKNILEV